MFVLSTQTIMPITDRSMEPPECQADYEVGGKPQRVHAQSLCGVPVLSLHLHPPAAPTMHMPPAAPGCWGLALCLNWCGTPGELARAPRKAQGNNPRRKSCSPAPRGCFFGFFLSQAVPFSTNEQFKCADEEGNRECKPWSWNNISNTRGCLSEKTAQPKGSFQMPSFVPNLPVCLSSSFFFSF